MDMAAEILWYVGKSSAPKRFDDFDEGAEDKFCACKILRGMGLCLGLMRALVFVHWQDLCGWYAMKSRYGW